MYKRKEALVPATFHFVLQVGLPQLRYQRMTLGWVLWSLKMFQLQSQISKKKRNYVTFTREETLNIGKNASIHGNSRATQNIQLEKAPFDFNGNSMNKASQVPQKSNVVDYFY